MMLANPRAHSGAHSGAHPRARSWARSWAGTIETLRDQIAAMEQGRLVSAGAVLPFGVAVIDSHLPNGGLRLGALHELQAAGPDIEFAAAPALFAAGILARHAGPVVWVGSRRDVFGHGLLQAGLDPNRIIFVDAGRTGLPAMEEALRHPDISGVVCELEGRLQLTASRRLQLAAEGSSALGLIIRRARRWSDGMLNMPSAAATRWRIASLPSPPVLAHAPDVQGLHRPLWQLELLRCRGGDASSWIVEGCDAQGRLALAAVLANRPAAPSQRYAAR